jgi:hypothetical protein
MSALEKKRSGGCRSCCGSRITSRQFAALSQANSSMSRVPWKHTRDCCSTTAQTRSERDALAGPCVSARDPTPGSLDRTRNAPAYSISLTDFKIIFQNRFLPVGTEFPRAGTKIQKAFSFVRPGAPMTIPQWTVGRNSSRSPKWFLFDQP